MTKNPIGLSKHTTTENRLQHEKNEISDNLFGLRARSIIQRTFPPKQKCYPLCRIPRSVVALIAATPCPHLAQHLDRAPDGLPQGMHAEVHPLREDNVVHYLPPPKKPRQKWQLFNIFLLARKQSELTFIYIFYSPKNTSENTLYEYLYFSSTRTWGIYWPSCSAENTSEWEKKVFHVSVAQEYVGNGIHLHSCARPPKNGISLHFFSPRIQSEGHRIYIYIYTFYSPRNSRNDY